MKVLYQWLAYLISSFIILRFCVPTLLSMNDTIGVAIGFVVAGIWFVITSFLAVKLFKTKNI